MILWFTHRVLLEEPWPELGPPLKTWPRMALFSMSLRQLAWLITTLIPLLDSSFTPSVRVSGAFQLTWNFGGIYNKDDGRRPDLVFTLTRAILFFLERSFILWLYIEMTTSSDWFKNGCSINYIIKLLS